MEERHLGEGIRYYRGRVKADYFEGDGSDLTNLPAGEAFPVGSVFIAVVSTNPATLLGYGTWASIGAGRVLVGLDSGDADFDVVEETGGAKTATIAQANLPNIFPCSYL